MQEINIKHHITLIKDMQTKIQLVKLSLFDWNRKGFQQSKVSVPRNFEVLVVLFDLQGNIDLNRLLHGVLVKSYCRNYGFRTHFVSDKFVRLGDFWTGFPVATDEEVGESKQSQMSDNYV